MFSQLKEIALIGLDRNGQIEFWSDGAMRILGFKSGYVLGKKMSEFMTFENNIDLSLVSVSTKLVCQNKMTIWTELTISPKTEGGHWILVRDCSVEKDYDKEIKRLIQTLKFALSDGKLSVWYLNTETQEFYTEANFSDTVGTDPMMGWSIDELKSICTPEDREKMSRFFASFSSKNENKMEFKTVSNFDLGAQWFELNGQLRTLGTDEKIVIGTIKNITDSKRVQFAQEQLSKMSALADIAAGIAHEVNNPLAIIGLRLSRLMSSVQPSPDQYESVRKDVSIITDNLSRIEQIVKSLKVFSIGHVDIEKEDFYINKVEQDLKVQLKDKIEKAKVQLRIIGNTNVQIFSSYTHLMQALHLLMNNAIEAVSKQSNRWIEVAFVHDEKSLKIYITDSGSGIPQNIASKMMQPFFTTKEPGKVLGLGLSTAKGLIEGIGGQLKYDPHYHNTRFVVELPIGAASKKAA